MSETAVERFQKRIVEMIDKGNTGWHITPGEKWHSLSIEEKCSALLQMWDSPKEKLDFKDSCKDQPPMTGLSKIQVV